MSHFTVLVIERPGCPLAEDLLAPYDENTQVAPYEVDCYCKKHNLFMATQAALKAHFGGDFRTIFRETYQGGNDEATWQAHIKPYEDKEREFKVTLADRAIPDPDCEDCHGTGKHLSRYNPKSQWDWYQIGGRWTGFFTPKPGADAKIGNPGVMTPEAPEGTADEVYVKDIVLPIRKTFAFVTPDGVWHERADMGWWGMTRDEREEEYDKEWAAMEAGLQPDDRLVLCDCHI
jgi:hypothetical protein